MKSYELERSARPGQGGIEWVDNAKAILIYLVVLGHFSALDRCTKDVIYAFHLPAFLVITGFLLGRKFGRSGFVALWTKQIAPYLRLYGFFSVLSIGLWIVMDQPLRHGFSELGNAFCGMVYGVHGSELLLVHANAPLWYLPFLVTSLLGVFLIRQLPVSAGWCATLAYFAFSIAYPELSDRRLPWSIDVGGVGVLCVFGGITLRELLESREQPIERLAPSIVYLGIAVVGVALLCVTAPWNGTTNLNKAVFGANGLLYLVNAAIGTAALLAVSMALPLTGLAHRMSRQTLVIFCTHIYFVKSLNKLLPAVGPMATLFMLFGLAFATTIACLVLAGFVDEWIRRHVMRR